MVTDQLNKHLVLQSLVLSVDVHRRIVFRLDGFFTPSLWTFTCVVLGDQVAVGLDAGVVVLEGCWVAERRPLDSHRPPDRGEEADLLPVDPDRLPLLARRTPGGRDEITQDSLSSSSSLSDQTEHRRSDFKEFHSPTDGHDWLWVGLKDRTRKPVVRCSLNVYSVSGVHV